jgi:hypothetical protein
MRWVTGFWSRALLLGTLVILVTLPSTSASPAPNRVLFPPFAHSQRSLSDSVQLYGCGSALAVYPSFTLRTGNGTFSDSAKIARSCPGNPAFVRSEATSSIYAYVRLPGFTTGTHTVTVRWTVRASGWENLTAATCILHNGTASPAFTSECYEQGYATVFGFDQIYDESTGTTIHPTTLWSGPDNASYQSHSETCYSTGCTYSNSTTSNLTNKSFSINSNASWVFNASFASGDSYWLETGIIGDVDVEYSSQNAGWSNGILGNAHVIMRGPLDGASFTSATIV